MCIAIIFPLSTNHIIDLWQKVEFRRLSLTCSTGFQIWPLHVVVSQSTAEECIKTKSSNAGHSERAEIIGFFFSLNVKICVILHSLAVVHLGAPASTTSNATTTPQIKNLIGWVRKYKSAARATRTLEQFEQHLGFWRQLSRTKSLKFAVFT